MGRKIKVSPEQKIYAVEDYLSGKKRMSQVIFELNVTKKSFDQWVRKYKLHGSKGLQPLTKNKYYSPELKQKAIIDYLNGEGSLFDICNKYDISNHGLLIMWIKKYNGHEEIKCHNAQGDKVMTKGRKTTYEERIEIVAFCVANNDNYNLACEKFKVSYQQAYAWVQKYRKKGHEALADNRGKRKNVEEMTDSEKVTAQLKLLAAENMKLKMENDFLKKLDEVERRREKAEHIRKTNT